MVDNTSATVEFWWNYGGVLRGQAPKMIGFLNDYMTDSNKYPHPPFSALVNKCLLYYNNDVNAGDCLISQLYKESEYYFFHWTNLKTNIYYATINIAIKVPNSKFQLSYLDWFNMEVKVLQSDIDGSGNFSYTAPIIPFNMELRRIS